MVEKIYEFGNPFPIYIQEDSDAEDYSSVELPLWIRKGWNKEQDKYGRSNW